MVSVGIVVTIAGKGKIPSFGSLFVRMSASADLFVDDVTKAGDSTSPISASSLKGWPAASSCTLPQWKRTMTFNQRGVLRDEYDEVLSDFPAQPCGCRNLCEGLRCS